MNPARTTSTRPTTLRLSKCPPLPRRRSFDNEFGIARSLRIPHSALAMLTPRYLVPFHPRELPHFFTDVLVIGGGLAGLRAANAIDDRLSALVVTKDAIQQSNSSYAQG